MLILGGNLSCQAIEDPNANCKKTISDLIWKVFGESMHSSFLQVTKTDQHDLWDAKRILC